LKNKKACHQKSFSDKKKQKPCQQKKNPDKKKTFVD
jgi:hypothetical protein